MADTTGAQASVGWGTWALTTLRGVLTAIVTAVVSVSFVPCRELIATGASTLVAFALLGLVASAVVYLLDGRGVPSLPVRLGLLVLAGVEIAVALYEARHVISGSELTVTVVALGGTL